MILRPYQVTAAAAVLASWESGHKLPVLVSPTGSGKTEMALEIMRRKLAYVGGQGLVLTHTRVLHRQVAAHQLILRIGVDCRPLYDLHRSLLSARLSASLALASVGKRLWIISLIELSATLRAMRAAVRQAVSALVTTVP